MICKKRGGFFVFLENEEVKYVFMNVVNHGSSHILITTSFIGYRCIIIVKYAIIINHYT